MIKWLKRDLNWLLILSLLMLATSAILKIVLPSTEEPDRIKGSVSYHIHISTDSITYKDTLIIL